MAKDTKKKMLIELKIQAENLTKKDIGTWRRAWQAAINPENPIRGPLYDVYTDVAADLHLTGCIDQRNRMGFKKSFKIVDKSGKEKPELSELFEVEWFKDFWNYAYDSIYYGYSLVEFGDIITEGRMRYSEVSLIPRKHVIPEYGVIVKKLATNGNEVCLILKGVLLTGVSESEKKIISVCFLNFARLALSKKNMLAYWDTFGEVFGMPIRIGKTASRDPKDTARAEKFLAEMGALSWGLFPEGTEIEIKETTRGDAFNVYDKRIDRANSEISKGILNQTMTIDSGSSLSQSEVHLEVFKNVIESDSDMFRDVVNWKLIPQMIRHGFPLEGCRFEWDESIDWTPEQQIQIEQMLLNNYEIDPKYFTEKYNITITGNKHQAFLKDDNRFFV
jgi:hypothetical protein